MQNTLPFRYHLSGITIESAVALPGLRESAELLPSVIRIRVGPVPVALPRSYPVEAGCEASQTECLYNFPSVATFYIKTGDEVVIDPYPGASWDEIRSLLFSVITAVLMYQRGFLPLHASAVEFRGQAYAFMGDSGAGKSTLVTYLAQQGHLVLADDLTLLSLDIRLQGVPAQVTPWAPWLKVWSDVLEGLRYPIDQLDKVPGKDWKFRLPVEGGNHPLPLGGIFVLDSGLPESPSRIDLLDLPDGIAKLMLFTYPVVLIRKVGQMPTLFRQCAQILEHVPIWTYTRPWSLNRVNESMLYLEQHLTSLESRQGKV